MTDADTSTSAKKLLGIFLSFFPATAAKGIWGNVCRQIGKTRQAIVLAIVMAKNKSLGLYFTIIHYFSETTKMLDIYY